MDYNTDSARESLTNPNEFGDPLKNDPNFYLNSAPTFEYNCIAFAMGMVDRWVDTALIPWHWWPPVEKGMTPEHLKNAFIYFGFKECGLDDQIEEEYDKVALYEKDNKWTHAARIVAEGVYHSKFGANYDGLHSRGDVLKLKYGHVYLIMKRLKSESHLTNENKGEAPRVVHVNRMIDIQGHLNSLVFFNGKLYSELTGLEVDIDTHGKLFYKKATH